MFRRFRRCTEFEFGLLMVFILMRTVYLGLGRSYMYGPGVGCLNDTVIFFFLKDGFCFSKLKRFSFLS
jgi:hypothetical protein